MYPKAKYDGVFGMWYGKGPGVDRCGDVFKHANAAGTAKHGGVLVLAGDDHAAKSSTLPHQSEHIFKACLIPHLNPSSVQDYLDLGLHGYAMSRFSGCWVAFKCVTDVVESGASVIVDPERVQIRIPGLRAAARRAQYPLARRHPRAGSAHPRLQGVRGDRLCARQRPRPRRLGFARGRAWASSRPASPSATSCRRSPTSASTRRWRAKSVCGSTRSRSPGRSSRRARGASPKAWKRSSWSRRSARSSSTRSRKSSTTGRKACARRAWSASSTTTASGAAPKASPRERGCCRRTTSIPRPWWRARSRRGSRSSA